MQKPIRISQKNHDRLALIRGKLSFTKQLDEILNMYFEQVGGEMESDEIKKKLRKLLHSK